MTAARFTLVAGVALALLAGAEAASAYIASNTIDELSRGRVCAIATTRDGSRVTDTRRWCERVRVATTEVKGR